MCMGLPFQIILSGFIHYNLETRKMFSICLGFLADFSAMQPWWKINDKVSSDREKMQSNDKALLSISHSV